MWHVRGRKDGHRVVVERSLKEKDHLEDLRKWEDNIKMGLKINRIERCGLD
jgi:hypothetical protein